MTVLAGGFFFLAVIVGHMLISFLLSLFPVLPAFLRTIYASVAMGEVNIVLPLLVFALCTAASFREMFPLYRVKWRVAGLSVLLLVAVWPAIMGCNMLSLLFVDNTVAAVELYIVTEPLPVMLLCIGVLGPVAEELAFRGYLLQSFLKSGKPVAAVVFSALAFGCMHMNINQMLYATALGLVMGFAVLYTGSLWPSVIMHCLLNSGEVLLMYGTFEEMAEEEALSLEGYAAATGVLPIIIAALIYILISYVASRFVLKRMRIAAGYKEAEGVVQQRIVRLPFGIGLLLSVIYMILSDLVW